MFSKKIMGALFTLSVSSFSFSQGLVLNQYDLRTDLNWLNQQGVIQLSTSTWPMSGNEIKRALAAANISHPTQEKVIQSVLKQLDAENDVLRASLYGATDKKPLPFTFANNDKARYQAALELNLGGENWDARLQVNGEQKPLMTDDKVNVEGSYLAGKLWNQWLIAGQIPTWWGTAHDGSLIRGDASRPVYGVTMQRDTQQAFETPWLAWIGDWQYQAFAGQLKDYHAVPDTKLIGLRVTAQPFSSLEIGGSRMLQWGGEGRPESLSSLWDAMLGSKDNGGTGKPDPSNQVAGVDFTWTLNQLTGLPVRIYGQVIGEDEAGGLPSKKMYLAGIDYASMYKNMPYQIYAEWADTRTNGKAQGLSYTHHIYKDGFYQQGYSLAHGMGGDGEMYSLGGDIRIDSINRVNGRLLYAKLNQSAHTNNHAFPDNDTVKALDITWSHYIQPNIPLKFNGWISDSDVNGRDNGLSVGVEFPLDSKAFKF